MSKFIVQLLLSVVVGVSAAVSFRPDVRAGLKETFHEAKGIVRETTGLALGAVGDVMGQAKATISVSARVNTKTSQENTKVDVKPNSNLEVQMTNGGALFNNVTSQLSVDGSSTVNSQTNGNANTQNAELSLKNKTKSTLDFSLDPVK
ncbi:MAG TPA: hypothetical protein VF896_02800 [Anaerolineales bacterium]